MSYPKAALNSPLTPAAALVLAVNHGSHLPVGPAHHCLQNISLYTLTHQRLMVTRHQKKPHKVIKLVMDRVPMNS